MAVLAESDARKCRPVLVGITVRNPVVAVLVVGQAERWTAMVVSILDAFVCRTLRARDFLLAGFWYDRVHSGFATMRTGPRVSAPLAL